MKTQFSQEQLAAPEIAEANSILKDCVHYGFCIPVCPTYVLLGDEYDSPRGRIDLIREMLEQGGAPRSSTVRHIDRCLSCLACTSTCAARVDYMHLVDRARIHIEKHFHRPLPDRVFRAFVARVLANPGLFRMLLGIGTSIRPLQNLLPGRLGSMLGMVPADPDRQQSPASGVYPAVGPRRMRVGLHTGCVQRVMGGRINAATLNLLTRHGCEVVVKNEAGCCGALDLHLGRELSAKTHAARVLDAWREELNPGGIEALVINTSGCGTVLKDYPHFFRGEAGRAEDAGRLAALSVDVTEIMGRLGLLSHSPVGSWRVAYHDACSLQHGQKITGPPRQLLREAGFLVLDIPERHFCCGSAGTYSLLEPEIATELGRRKARHVESTGPDIVATGNLGCMTQMARFTRLPVVHTVELLDWATGGPYPRALKGVQPGSSIGKFNEENAKGTSSPDVFW